MAPRRKAKKIDETVAIINATNEQPDGSHQMVRRSHVQKPDGNEKTTRGVKRLHLTEMNGPPEKKPRKVANKAKPKVVPVVEEESSENVRESIPVVVDEVAVDEVAVNDVAVDEVHVNDVAANEVAAGEVAVDEKKTDDQSVVIIKPKPVKKGRPAKKTVDADYIPKKPARRRGQKITEAKPEVPILAQVCNDSPHQYNLRTRRPKVVPRVPTNENIPKRRGRPPKKNVVQENKAILLNRVEKLVEATKAEKPKKPKPKTPKKPKKSKKPNKKVQISEDTAEEVPTVVNENDVNVPTVVNENDVNVPTVVNENDVNVPTVVNENDVNVPTVVNENDVNVPTVVNENDVVNVPKAPKKQVGKGRKKLNFRIVSRQIQAVTRGMPLQSVIRIQTPAVRAATRIIRSCSKPKEKPRDFSCQTEPDIATLPIVSPCGILMYYTPSDFYDLTEITTGIYGKVFKANLVATDGLVALKYFSKDIMQQMNTPNSFIQDEYDVHMQAHENANVVRLLGCFMRTGSHTFVLEYCPRGDLHNLIHEDKIILASNVIRLYARQLVSAVLYLQSQVGFIHKDIKPENILVAGDRNIKLSDFGCSLRMYEYRHVHNFQGNSADRDNFRTPGSFPYYAVEEYESHEFDSTTDVWAIACVVFEMFVRHRAFFKDVTDGHAECLPRIRNMMNRQYISRPFSQLQQSDPDAKALMESVFVTRLERPLIHQLAQHPWLKETD